MKAINQRKIPITISITLENAQHLDKRVQQEQTTISKIVNDLITQNKKGEK